MKKLTQNVGKPLIYLIELLVGILLLVNPDGFANGVLILAGSALIVLGAFSMIRYFRTKPTLEKMDYNLAVGLIEAAVGLFCVLRADWISNNSIMAILYGAGVLMIGFIKVQNAVDLLRLRIRFWQFAAINAVLTLIFAVVVLLNPSDDFIKFLAISLIVVAVLDIAALILSWQKPKEKEEAAEEPETDEE